MNRNNKQTRSLKLKLTTRSEKGQDLYIEGYFAVFNQETELWPGAFEEIAPGAFDGTLSKDIRALINHDTHYVLARTKSGTLELKTDNYGLWGRIKINPDDKDAMNLYARVKRGDVNQCSFGFKIPPGGETVDYREDGTAKWTVKKVELYEVSVVTFPQYTDTGVQARKAELERHRRKRKQPTPTTPAQLEIRKKALKKRLQKWQ